MPGRLFRPRWKPPRRGCPPRAASGFRRLPGGRTRSCRNGPIRADATAASCFACRNSLRHSPFASLPGRFSGRIAGPAALPLGGRDSAGGQPGPLVAGTVRAACELGPGAGCEGRESGREWVGMGANPPGKKLGEHLCPGSGRRLGASASRPEETAPGAGRSTLLAAASHSGSFATRLSKIQQFHNSAMPHFDDSEPNGSVLRRCFIPKVLGPTASHSGSFATRWATIQQRHNSAVPHSGGYQPDSATTWRCRIPEFAIR